MLKRIIDNVKDNYDKNNTYRVIMQKYNDAVNDKYYLEALMISYALVEDRLRSFLYYLGLIETRENNQLFLCEKNKEINDILKISSNKLDKYSFNDITTKTNSIKKIIKWVDKPKENMKKKTYLHILNYECESLDIGGIISTINEMNKWITYRNEVIHGLLNKNMDSLNKELEDRVLEGKRYFNFWSEQVKILKKENNLRNYLQLL